MPLPLGRGNLPPVLLQIVIAGTAATAAAAAAATLPIRRLENPLALGRPGVALSLSWQQQQRRPPSAPEGAIWERGTAVGMGGGGGGGGGSGGGSSTVSPPCQTAAGSLNVLLCGKWNGTTVGTGCCSSSSSIWRDLNPRTRHFFSRCGRRPLGRRRRRKWGKFTALLTT